MSADPPDPWLSERLHAFHATLPLAAGRPNAVLSLPDDRLLYLAALLRDTPQQPPALSPEEWREFLDLLRPHRVHALLAHRLGAWQDGRPAAIDEAGRQSRESHGDGHLHTEDACQGSVDRGPGVVDSAILSFIRGPPP